MIRLRHRPPQSQSPPRERLPLLKSRLKRLTAFGIPAALLFVAGASFAQPRVVATHPPNGAARVPANAVLIFAFDRPTAKHVSYCVSDFTSGGGGGLTTIPGCWAPLGGTPHITPLTPLPLWHLFRMKINPLSDTATTGYGKP